MHTMFDRPGPKNTEKALAVLAEGISRYNVNQVVVAPTWGDTGLAAAKLLQDTDVNLVVVTHNAGFKEPGTLEMPREVRKEIESFGAKVYTGTMPFRTIGVSIRDKRGAAQEDIVANSLRLLGQGVKVCVEIALMASDAGLITPDDVLTVAGTARGADTVALIAPQSSNKLFQLKIREILIKPFDW